MVLDGNLEEAIDSTYKLFPGILERNTNLLFALKIREFIEMISKANSAPGSSRQHVNLNKQECSMLMDSEAAAVVNGNSFNNNGYVTHKTPANIKNNGTAEEEMGF